MGRMPANLSAETRQQKDKGPSQAASNPVMRTSSLSPIS